MPAPQLVGSLLLLATTFIVPAGASAVSLSERKLSSRATISCAVTADCSKAGYTLPKNSHYYCAKKVCSWACNTGYTASGSTCVKLVSSSSTKAAVVATSGDDNNDDHQEDHNNDQKDDDDNKGNHDQAGLDLFFSLLDNLADVLLFFDNLERGHFRVDYLVPSFLLPRSLHFDELELSGDGSSFFSGWFWLNQTDPTHGSVSYIDQADSMAQNLTYISSSGTAIISIDRVSRLAAGTPRNSVRLSTNDVYNAGSLIIADFKHVPVGCGTWPAFWAYNNPWPQMGEIDIYEGVNSRTFNQYTLHTASGCVRNTTIPMTGNTEWASADCYAYSGSSGCTVFDYDPTSYGAGFNAAGGGVFALQFAETGISIWHWQRSNIPSDVKNGAPRPRTWGTPVAAWDGSTCDTRTFFQDLMLTFASRCFDITTCGDWAGIDSVFEASDLSGACYPKYANCTAANMDPAAFAQAYFEVNYIKAFAI
ncbi:hypothetical protein JCM1840_001088 [Sporobolomyces johnsonii]